MKPTLVEVACSLDALLQDGNHLYLKLEPEIVDFNKSDAFILKILSKNSSLDIEISEDRFLEILSLLRTAIFDNTNINLICWNIKNLFSFVLAKTRIILGYQCKLLDLKVAESFIGVRSHAPTNFKELQLRVKNLIQDSSWDKFKLINALVYKDLIAEVIPSIETEGVFNYVERKILFPYYEIEGQVGGRMVCSLVHDHSFNPHSLSVEQKLNLKPKGSGLSFVSFDFCYMEVCILAWLCKDTSLLSLLEGDDFYKSLFKLVLGRDCLTDDERNLAKRLFLPIVYGQSFKSLSTSLKIDLEVAKDYVTKVQNLFPATFNWVNNYKHTDVCEDYVGRKRHLDEEYKYRAFIVQSPAAVFCLEKLVELYKSLKFYAKVVASIHDGYVTVIEDKHVDSVVLMGKKALESESQIFKGLKLKINSKISKTFA